MRTRQKCLPSLLNDSQSELNMILRFLLMESNLKMCNLQSFWDWRYKLCKKLSQRIGILRKIRYCLPLKHRFLFYNVMIRPVMDYVNIVWSSCDKRRNCLNRVLKLQKRAARIILDAHSQASSVKLFNKL